MSVYIVEAYTERGAHIDGVFPTEQQADQRAKLLDADGLHFAIHCFPHNDFPIYAIEEAIGILRYGTKQEVRKFLASLERKKGNGYEYCTIHVLDGGWEAPSVGKDAMGLLEHIHVDNSYLDAGWRRWLV